MEGREAERRFCKKTDLDRGLMVPSCLLTPETPGDRHITTAKATIQFSSCSAFLTPPCLQERHSAENLGRYDFSDLPILDLDLQDHDQNNSVHRTTQRSPLLPEDRVIGNGKVTPRVDFIVKLLALGCLHICKKIFKMLEPLDLCRAATVSRKWRGCIKQDREIHELLKKHLHIHQDYCDLKGKENLGTPKWLKNTPTLEFERDPLVELDNQNSARELRTRHPTSKQIQSHSTGQNSSVITNSDGLRKCPKCTSPSRNEDMKNECLCEVCGLTFCSVCFKDSKLHTASDCSGLEVSQMLETTRKKSKARRSKKETIGSKRSRDRVRRL